MAHAQSAATPAKTHAQALNDALTALKTAPDEAAAAALESRIEAHWADAASPTAKLLLSRGARELSEGASNEALDSFDAALDLDPDLTDAWRGRAQARFRAGDLAGAIRDLGETLKREPRQFNALKDLSHVAEARKDWRGALAAWQRVLDLDPKAPNGQTRLRELKRRAIGDET